MMIDMKQSKAYFNWEAEELGVENVPVVVGVSVAVGVGEASDGRVVSHSDSAVETESDSDPFTFDVTFTRVVSFQVEDEVRAGLEHGHDDVAVLVVQKGIIEL